MRYGAQAIIEQIKVKKGYIEGAVARKGGDLLHFDCGGFRVAGLSGGVMNKMFSPSEKKHILLFFIYFNSSFNSFI
jgi:hypothetical protein